jgi:hypothetical protein
MPKAKRRTVHGRVEEVGQRLRKLPLYKSKQYLAKEECIKEALKSYYNLDEHEISNLRIVGVVFNVPYSTLRDRDKGGRSLVENGDYNTCLNEA